MFYNCSSYNYYYHRASFFDPKKKRKHFLEVVNIEKKKKTIIPLNVLCRANPVMRLKDSLQFDDFFYIISFDQKSALLAPLGHSWMDFPPMCLLLLNLLQFEDFFCVCVLPFKQLLPRKVKAWQKIIQINVISLITLRTHMNYEKNGFVLHFL